MSLKKNQLTIIILMMLIFDTSGILFQENMKKRPWMVMNNDSKTTKKEGVPAKTLEFFKE